MNNNRSLQVTVLSIGLVALTSCPSIAQGFAQRHPRRYEVNQRDNRIRGQINSDAGHLGGSYNRLQKQANRIQGQQRRDAASNGGYITRGQQVQLNQQESRLANRMRFDSIHPRRAQVDNRSANINQSLNRDYGKLGGNYNSLKQQDASIYQTQRSDAAANGGHITKTEQQQLNSQESQLRQQVNQDYRR